MDPRQYREEFEDLVTELDGLQYHFEEANFQYGDHDEEDPFSGHPPEHGAIEVLHTLLSRLTNFLGGALEAFEEKEHLPVADQIQSLSGITGLIGALEKAKEIMHKDPADQQADPIDLDEIRSEGYGSAACFQCNQVIFDDDSSKERALLLCDSCERSVLASSVNEEEWAELFGLLDSLMDSLIPIRQEIKSLGRGLGPVAAPVEPDPLPLPPDTNLEDLLEAEENLKTTKYMSVETEEGWKRPVNIPGNLFSGFIEVRIYGKEVWIETPHEGRQSRYIAEWMHGGINQAVGDTLEEVFKEARRRIGEQVIPDFLPDDI